MPKKKGQIRRLSLGNWQIRIQGKDESGKRKSKSISGFETRDDAENALDELLEEIKLKSRQPKVVKKTFAQLFDAYLKFIKPDVREQSFNTYEKIIKNYLRPKLDEIYLTELTTYDVEELYSELLETYSGTTIQKAHSLLKASLTKARHWKWIKENVCEDVRSPKIDTEEKVPLSLSELTSFLDVCSDEQKALWLFFGLTGCRAQEVCGAKWAHLENDIFNVREVLVQSKFATNFQKPKTKKSVRAIPMEIELIEILEKHRERQNEQKLKLGCLWENLDLIFPRIDGGVRRLSNLWRECEEVRIKAGINRKVTPHILRHTFATLAVKSGMKLQAVSDLLGHSTIAFTAKIYTHLGMEDKQEVTSVLTKLLFRGVSEVRENSILTPESDAVN